jgi:uncharacterized MAPEG superfamily protein
MAAVWQTHEYRGELPCLVLKRPISCYILPRVAYARRDRISKKTNRKVNAMSTELFYLFLSAILLTLIWIPHVIGQVRAGGSLQPDEYVTLRDTSGYPDWVKRAGRTHINLVEQFGAFAGLVVVGQLAAVSTTLTAAAAVTFFWARVAHAIIMLSGFKHFMARTLVFRYRSALCRTFLVLERESLLALRYLKS